MLQLLIAQDLWQAHYQILSIIFDVLPNVKHEELNISIATVFLNTQILKI